MGFCNIRGCGGWTQVSIAFFGFVFEAISPIMPWRSNPPVLGYSSERTWTLIGIKGFTNKGYMESYNIACDAAARMERDTLLTCATGLCRFYKDKCNGYSSFAYGTYGALSLVLFAALLTFIGTLLACRGTMQSLKILTMLYVLCILSLAGAIVLWWDVSEYAFDTFNAMSFYPEPAYSVGVFVGGFGALLALFNSFLTCIEFNKAKREELGITSDDEFDSEGSG